MDREKLSDRDEVIEKKKTTTDELTLNEMTAIMKERFTRSGTDDVRAMFYYKAIENGCTGGETFQMIDSIGIVIIQCNTPYQTFDVYTH